MTQKQSLKLFEERNVRTIWDDTQEKWYFSVVDVIQVLTENDYQTARKYWNKLKERILAEAGQPVTIVTSSNYVLRMAKCVGEYKRHKGLHASIGRNLAYRRWRSKKRITNRRAVV